MNSSNVGRNPFLDIVKLFFAIMIVLFHFGENILPGGRVAVEGFFMISGYFMMVSIGKYDSRENMGIVKNGGGLN